MHSPSPSHVSHSTASLLPQTLANESLDHTRHSTSLSSNDFGATNIEAYHEDTNDSGIHPTYVVDTATTEYGVDPFDVTSTRDFGRPNDLVEYEHGFDSPTGFNVKAPFQLHGSINPGYDMSGPSTYDFASFNANISAGVEHGNNELVWFDSPSNASQFNAGVGVGFENDMRISNIFDGSAPQSLSHTQGFDSLGLVDEAPFTSALFQPSFQPLSNMLSFAPPPFSLIQHRTPCPWPGCTESFVRSTDIQRHWDSVHLGIRYHCFWVGCPNNGNKGYCRLEKLRSHQRQKHGSA